MNREDFIFSIPQLKEYLRIKGWDVKRIVFPTMGTKESFFLLIPTYYVDLIDWYNPDDPLRQMVLYNELESDVKEYETKDPISDQPFSPVPGIVHRHPDRCLLMLTNICAVHCRFCFRKHMLSTNKANVEKCIRYIEQHPELWEVIFSGGDPFMLTEPFLLKIISRLKKIKHIKMIRFHTRVPTVYPQAITENFMKILAKARPLSIIIHVNHPKEITEEFIASVKKLQKINPILLSQTVLMKGINNDLTVLDTLMRKLTEVGIKPYYLHHLDLTAGTDHFRISIEEGMSLVRQLRNNLSGVAMPDYVIDLPSGQGKVSAFSLQLVKDNTYKVQAFDGTEVTYTDFAA